MLFSPIVYKILLSFFIPELRALELQTGYFSLRHVKAATGNFDPANKIGEGGFGPVYKVSISCWYILIILRLYVEKSATVRLSKESVHKGFHIGIT